MLESGYIKLNSGCVAKQNKMPSISTLDTARRMPGRQGRQDIWRYPYHRRCTSVLYIYTTAIPNDVSMEDLG